MQRESSILSFDWLQKQEIKTTTEDGTALEKAW